MSIEVRGLIAGVIAALVALSGAFGVASLVRAAHPEPSPVAAGPASSGPSPSASGSQPALVASGQGYFKNSCASCHGAHGEGGDGPNLQQTGLSDSQIATSIENGYPPSMPAFGAKYHTPEIQALTAYIRTLR